MNLNINLQDWCDVLQDALYWETVGPDRAILLYKYAHQAHEKGYEYFINGIGGAQIDLTKIYKQFMLLHTLRSEHK
jgi:hypothetical protein